MSLERLAHQVLLPATVTTEVTPWLRDLFARGCVSVLLGETRAEYLQRRMAPTRVQRETPAVVRALVNELRTLADGPPIVAVDHELGGIQRFGQLVAALPSTADAAVLPPEELIAYACRVGRGLADLGVTLTLGPVVDVVRGPNPWLEGRNLGPNPEVVANVGACLVRGLQAGGVSATAKHFPGNPTVLNDPATSVAFVEAHVDDLRKLDLRPFQAVIAAGVRAIMLGPAVVTAIDSARPASLSPAVVELLRDELGFQGAVITDDLDARSILRDCDLGDVAVDALAAGADLLLVGEEHAGGCASAIVAAMGTGSLQSERLRQAAANVERLATGTLRRMESSLDRRCRGDPTRL